MATAELSRRSTAEEALGGRSLAGLRAVVTGASSGIGEETARVLAKGGAEVLLACRSLDSGQAAAERIRGEVGAGAKLSVRALDLSDLDSVRAFAEASRGDGPIDLLIANAGIMATPPARTRQGHELQLGTNHLGHFLLVELLRPRLSAQARVVVVASDLHRRGRGARLLATLSTGPGEKYVPFDAYGDSKLANILFARALARRLGPGQSAYALHPGVIPTKLTRHMGVSGAIFRAVGGLFMKSIPQGAATSIYAATAPGLEARSGAYLADCRPATPSADAQDDALAEKLWELSEERVSAAHQ